MYFLYFYLELRISETPQYSMITNTSDVDVCRIDVIPRLHDTTGYQTGCTTGFTTGCQTGCTTTLTTGWMFVYTIQPVVQPVVKSV